MTANYHISPQEFPYLEVRVIEALLDQLPMIEGRRAAHEAQTAFILASINSKQPVQYDAFVMPFAKQTTRNKTPAWVLQDLRAGIEMGVVSQEFVDALRTDGIEVV